MGAAKALYGELTGETNGTSGAWFEILLTGSNGHKTFASTRENAKLFFAVLAAQVDPLNDTLAQLEDEIATVFYGVLPDDIYLYRVQA